MVTPTITLPVSLVASGLTYAPAACEWPPIIFDAAGGGASNRLH